MSATYRVRRYGTSRGFWGEVEHRKPLDPDREPKKVQRRTHQARIGDCCRTSSVYNVTEEMDEKTGEIKRLRHFMGRVQCDGRIIAMVARGFAKSHPGIALAPSHWGGCYEARGA
jgi:hypothetical protein